jgi:hypothetical protein
VELLGFGNELEVAGDSLLNAEGEATPSKLERCFTIVADREDCEEAKLSMQSRVRDALSARQRLQSYSVAAKASRIRDAHCSRPNAREFTKVVGLAVNTRCAAFG